MNRSDTSKTTSVPPSMARHKRTVRSTGPGGYSRSSVDGSGAMGGMPKMSKTQSKKPSKSGY